jgi:hypothetical protein
MVWHDGNKSIDGLVKHVVDDKAWKHIDATWPKFVVEPHNVILKLAIDGFGVQSSSWCTWPIMFFIYNLPPWFVTNKFFVIFTLVILGKESVKMHNMDVYLAPLIEELQVLWKGVVVYDVAKVV